MRVGQHSQSPKGCWAGLLLLCCWAVLPATLHAASRLKWDEVGLPPMRTFSPKDYRGGTQNWDIVQDSRGIIYVANNDGVLEFDGQRWRLIPIPGQSATRSLAVDARGRVLVGAIGDFGYLEPRPDGPPRFVSLLSDVPQDAREFSDVWHTFVRGDEVIFCSYQRLFRWRGEVIEVVEPRTAFHRAFNVDDQVYVREVGHGLLQLHDDGLRPVPDSQQFAQERVYGVLSLIGNKDAARPRLLVGERKRGWWLGAEGGFQRWPTAVDDQLASGLLYSAQQLPDGRLALGTLQQGLFLLDTLGQQVGYLGRQQGLPDPAVLGQFVDREGGLWLGLDRGLARAEIHAALSQFDERNGLLGEVFSVQRYQGQLCAGTSRGLFCLRA